MESGGDRRWNVLSIVLCRYTVDTPRPGENEAPRGPPSVCDCIIYPLSLLYAAINSVYTPGKVFPKHRRAWLPAYPLSILLCPDIVHLPTYTYPNTENTLPPWLSISTSFFYSHPPFALPLPPSTNSILHPAIKFHSISVPLVP